jgi:pyruvate dehydrogenase E2 component (dihydrolipoamide acetyltransferase)
VKPTVNDLLTRFVGVALVRNPAINATFEGDEIHRHASAHVGIAVAAPTGLVVPVIRDADRRSVQEIARSRAELVGRARDGKLTREDMSDGTFTISNLGMYGIEEFVAVLNPPQVAIIAVGAVKPTPVVVEGEVDVAPMMHVTLTCDHRAIDGSDGAEFLQTLVALVEQPALAL